MCAKVIAGLLQAARSASRPIRPKPLMPTRILRRETLQCCWPFASDPRRSLVPAAQAARYSGRARSRWHTRTLIS